MRAILEAAGFRVREWLDVSGESAVGPGKVPPVTIQRLVMGDELEAIGRAGKRNQLEGRVLMIQAALDKT